MLYANEAQARAAAAQVTIRGDWDVATAEREGSPATLRGWCPLFWQAMGRPILRELVITATGPFARGGERDYGSAEQRHVFMWPVV